MDTKQNLIDLVIRQIQIDILNGDLTAIDLMLRAVDNDVLEAYLPEDRQ